MFDPYCDCYVSVSCTLSLFLSTIVTLVSRSLRVWSSMRLLWWCPVHFEFTSLRLLRLLRVSCSFSLIFFMPVTLVFLADLIWSFCDSHVVFLCSLSFTLCAVIIISISCTLCLIIFAIVTLESNTRWVWWSLRLLCWCLAHFQFRLLCDRFLCLIFFCDD